MKTAIKLLVILLLIIQSSCDSTDTIQLSGEFMTWHTLTLEVPGPETTEKAAVNPFLDYRLVAVFSNGEHTFTVPGFYAADGNAAETSSEARNVRR